MPKVRLFKSFPYQILSEDVALYELKVALMANTYTPSHDHEAWDDSGVSEHEVDDTTYEAGGKALTLKAGSPHFVIIIDKATNKYGLMADDVVFSGCEFTARYAVIYSSKEPGDKFLLGWIDFAEDLVLDQENLNIEWDDGVVFNLEVEDVPIEIPDIPVTLRSSTDNEIDAYIEVDSAKLLEFTDADTFGLVTFNAETQEVDTHKLDSAGMVAMGIALAKTGSVIGIVTFGDIDFGEALSSILTDSWGGEAGKYVGEEHFYPTGTPYIFVGRKGMEEGEAKVFAAVGPDSLVASVLIKEGGLIIETVT